jgi:ABC-type nitrate/sulfonate/bicarbonate transport system substrate-binding protein
MARRHCGVDVGVLQIKDYGEFEAAIFDGAADVLIDHVEFLYREAANGKRLTFFCAPKIVRGLELVVPKGIEQAQELAGKTMAVRDSGRPHAITLWLRMMGLEDKVKTLIVKDSDVGRWAQWKKLLSGECGAAFIDPLYLSAALQAGLKVLAVPDLPVVGHYAQACTARFARENSSLLQSYVKAVIHALVFMKYDRPAVMKIISGEPMTRMNIADAATMESHFAAIVEKLQIKPYPTPQAIQNTYEIAVDEYGAGSINPMTLWDLHWVKALDDEGFIDELLKAWGGR